MATLFDKIWDQHVVSRDGSGGDLIYIDRHLVHEVSSPQAFSGLRQSGRTLRSVQRHLAVQDHNVPTTAERASVVHNAQSAAQIDTLRSNARATGMALLDLDDPRQGIVHVIAPEQGHVLPGSTIVCGDSHTATLGALGAIAWGIGTSEVEHVMATQSLWMRKPKVLGLRLAESLGAGVYAKDLALSIVRQIGTSGGSGHAIEYFGPAVQSLSMEARLTLCNMSIEAGSRFGVVAPDVVTLAYLRAVLQGRALPWLDEALAQWSGMRTDSTADFAAVVDIDAAAVQPMVTWGTTPADCAPFGARVPDDSARGLAETGPASASHEAALRYMGLRIGQPLADVPIQVAFIGSCTNARIEDLRAAASVVKGRRVASTVRGLVVPGSTAVKRAAEAEGLAGIFLDAGFEWRESGCSMCIGMNGDSLLPGQRSASSSNRNFENRQGPGGRTHLMSPAAVAASAVRGLLTDPREFLP